MQRATWQSQTCFESSYGIVYNTFLALLILTHQIDTSYLLRNKQNTHKPTWLSHTRPKDTIDIEEDLPVHLTLARFWAIAADMFEVTFPSTAHWIRTDKLVLRKLENLAVALLELDFGLWLVSLLSPLTVTLYLKLQNSRSTCHCKILMFPIKLSLLPLEHLSMWLTNDNNH